MNINPRLTTLTSVASESPKPSDQAIGYLVSCAGNNGDSSDYLVTLSLSPANTGTCKISSVRQNN